MRKLIVFLCAVLLTGTIFAQSKQEQQVAAAVEQLKTAMVEGEKSKLEQIVDDQLSYGHSSGVVETKQQFIEKFVTGKSDFVTIELKDQTIQVAGETAIVRHLLNAQTNDSGKPGEVHLKIMLVFHKTKAGWKLLARQAVKVV
jgi:ketosteroid isomerase-like protein